MTDTPKHIWLAPLWDGDSDERGDRVFASVFKTKKGGAHSPVPLVKYTRTEPAEKAASKPDTAALEAAAGQIRAATYRAWDAVLCGKPNAIQSDLYTEMNTPTEGRMVCEVTTIYRRESDLNAVGILLRITREPVFDDWDEKFEGAPCPTEPVHYIETLDGREFRWTCARFVNVPARTKDF